jgi:TRAP-type uncharacterized transport system substrate-binding protein
MFRILLLSAGLALAVPSLSYADTPDPNVLTVCSGSKTKNYYFAVSEWLKRISHDLFQRAVNMPTSGALDNMRQMTNGTCVAGPVQDDVRTQFVVENPASRDNLSVLKVMYREYVHVLCPAALKASTLSEFAKLPGTKKLIVDQDGSGTAVTWRMLWQSNEKLYGSIQRDNQPADITSATAVMDSTDTCMLMVSGLNSSDMVAANQRSVSTQNGKPGLKLISIDDSNFANIKGLDGKALYTPVQVVPQAPKNNQPGLYNNLINNGGFWSSPSITVLTVPAVLMIRNDWKEAIGREKLNRIVDALVDALPTIWARVNPAGQNN